MFLAWMAGGTESFRQECDTFFAYSMPLNTYDGPNQLYYYCGITGKHHGQVNDQDEVTTDTSKNLKTNEEVTMVIFHSDYIVKFIPHSLFTTFINLEYLLIYVNNKFETMKREYLRNANKLKNLDIHQNSIKKIDGNVFSEAKNLEHINFGNNQIESVNKEAFNGLPNLQGVYLHQNKIKNLHPTTFQSIASLNILELRGDENCVNDRFSRANQNYPEIEEIISSQCTFELDSVEIKAIQKMAKENKIYISNLIYKLKGMKAEINSQKDKVKELAEHQKQFDTEIANQQKPLEGQIASEKLQMETKITQLEAKLATQQMELLHECKSELQLEFAKHRNQIESMFAIEKLQMEIKNAQMETKITQMERKVE